MFAEGKLKSVYDLKLHEEVWLDNYTVVKRVPGGWIYQFRFPPPEGCDIGVFVPFDNDFQE